MTNNEEIIRLENENNNLVEQIKSIKEGNESRIDRITSIRNEKDRELAVKDVEFTEAIQKKIKLEEKVTCHIDVLYGCSECG